MREWNANSQYVSRFLQTIQMLVVVKDHAYLQMAVPAWMGIPGRAAQLCMCFLVAIIFAAPNFFFS